VRAAAKARAPRPPRQCECNPGVWGTSGIIDASGLFGPDTWLSDVQAHSPTVAPRGSSVTVEDGQLFMLTPAD
jgi:hypothetical protein